MVLNIITKLRTLWLAALAMVLVAAACSQSSEVDGPTRVVVTTSVLGDVVANIVGTNAVVEVLIPTGQDPHGFQASAAQAASMREADLVIAVGLGLEEGLSDSLDNAVSDGATVLELAPRLEPIALRSDPETLDPHFWLDPQRMAEAVAVISNALGEVDPTVDWDATAGRYRLNIESALASSVETLSAVPPERRFLITNHDSLSYWAQRYGFEVLGTIVGGSTQSDPSPADLADLIGLIEDTGIDAIFIESTASTELADTISGEVGFPVSIVEVFTGSLGGAGTGADTYVGMIETNAARVAEALVVG
ncbi:MAG: metal ABC transporter substrate-binding protein [Acidimicrobiia bacterium]|nr:metal ABC transporter substrate-binding protein [Acidimicrobiia bacterium]